MGKDVEIRESPKIGETKCVPAYVYRNKSKKQGSRGNDGNTLKLAARRWITSLRKIC
jgi:hypothetical protein